jgi:hypothetical protein
MGSGGGPPPPPNDGDKVLREIRDLLKANQATSLAMLAVISGEQDPSRAIAAVSRSLQADSASNGGLVITDTNLLNEQGMVISGARGLYNQLATTALPSQQRASQMIGFRNVLQSKAFSLYSWGSALKQFATPNRPPGESPEDALGQQRAFSGGVGSLSESQIRRATGVRNASNMLDANVISQEEYDSFLENSGSGSLEDRRAAVGSYKDMILKRLAPGGDVSGMLGGPLDDIGRAAAGRSGRLAGMFALGRGLVGAGRALAGPIGMAASATEAVYRTADMLYTPARQGAGLGYGFSYNPLSDGYKVGLGRTIGTNISALTSFGLSKDQTEGARRAIESMGLGGRGQEEMYKDFYRSMTDVIEDTQLGAETLAPFYEQFMRAGGDDVEIQKLTQMLKDDLPKAAAASRMSLEQMANTLQATTQAAKQSIFNVRTDTEIQEDVTKAAMGGAPPGALAATAGQNNYLIARVMSERNKMGENIGPFIAMQDVAGQQVEIAKTLRERLGDMSAEDFEERRLNDEPFSTQVSLTAKLLQIDENTIQQIYETGLGDYQAGQVLMDRFELDKAKDTGMVKGPRGPISRPRSGVGGDYDAITTQTIKGSNIDLNSKGGSQEIQRFYEDELLTLQNSLSEEEWKEFQEELKDLSDPDDKNMDVYNLIKGRAEELIVDAIKPGGGDGEIDLAPDIKKWFRLSFSSSSGSGENANESFSTGGTTTSSGLSRRAMANNQIPRPTS